MFEILNHLIPQFHAIGDGTIPSISASIVIAMLFILGLSFVFLVWHFLNFNRRLRGIKALISSQSKENLSMERRSILERAFSLKPVDIGYLWREFDESLVSSPDNQFLYNTLDAEHFFNTRTLARGLTGSRLLAATPSFLVAIGVLGTFIGLTIGLDGLNVDSSEIDVLKSDIDQMISSAAVAFMTSVWGVGLSLILNFIEKFLESRVLKKVLKLQQDIDFLYPRVSAEQSLVHISENSQASKDALLELHERIGSKLQEAVNGISEEMQSALTDTLNQVMKPAIEALVDKTSQQSTEALESLIKNFMQGLSKAGEGQGQQLKEAANQVNEAVQKIGSEISSLSSSFTEQQQAMSVASQQRQQKMDEHHQRLINAAEEKQDAMEHKFSELMNQLTSSLNDQFSATRDHEERRSKQLEQQAADSSIQHNNLISNIENILTQIARQSEESAIQHQKLVGELRNASQNLVESSSHMDSSANQLGVLSANLKAASDMLSGDISSAAESVIQLSGQHQKLIEAVDERMKTLQGIQISISECVEALDGTSQMLSGGLETFGQTQDEFLSGVREQFNQLGDTLQTQVEQIEKQASEWLQSYASEVNSQVNDRMEEWNNQTLKFTNQMLSTVQSIGNVVDELEDKR